MLLDDFCAYGLLLWPSSLKKKFLKGATYFCPALDPPLRRSGRKTTKLVQNHECFIPTKFHKNPSSGSEEEVENVSYIYMHVCTPPLFFQQNKCLKNLYKFFTCANLNYKHSLTDKHVNCTKYMQI